MRKQLMKAPLPTWLKVKLLKLSGGRRDEEKTYAEVGWTLGYHHLESFGVDSDNVPKFDHGAFKKASATLRAIFANEEHPHGDLIDFIPVKRRRQFLRGLLWGAGGRDWSELIDQDRLGGWASLIGR